MPKDEVGEGKVEVDLPVNLRAGTTLSKESVGLGAYRPNAVLSLIPAMIKKDSGANTDSTARLRSGSAATEPIVAATRGGNSTATHPSGRSCRSIRPSFKMTTPVGKARGMTMFVTHLSS